MVETKQCECGCGQLTKPGKRFIWGHSRQKKSILERQRLLDEYNKVFLLPPTCACGCGQQIILKSNYKCYGIPRYIRGHATKGKYLSEQACQNMSKSKIGHVVSKETIEKIKQANTGKRRSEEVIEKNRKAQTGKVLSEETKEKISRSRIGKHLSEKTKEKMRKPKPPGFGKTMSYIRKGKTKDIYPKLARSKETKEKISRTMKQLLQDPEFRERRLKAIFVGLDVKPNKAEKLLAGFLNKILPNEYRYAGDGSILIGYKNPDFVNINGQKKLIELYGDYWHSEKRTGRTKIEEENQRIRHFAKYGYATLVVWEHELKDLLSLKEKVFGFARNK